MVVASGLCAGAGQGLSIARGQYRDREMEADAGPQQHKVRGSSKYPLLHFWRSG